MPTIANGHRSLRSITIVTSAGNIIVESVWRWLAAVNRPVMVGHTAWRRVIVLVLNTANTSPYAVWRYCHVMVNYAVSFVTRLALLLPVIRFGIVHVGRVRQLAGWLHVTRYRYCLPGTAVGLE